MGLRQQCNGLNLEKFKIVYNNNKYHFRYWLKRKKKLKLKIRHSKWVLPMLHQCGVIYN